MDLDEPLHARRVVNLLGKDWNLKPVSGAPAYTVRGIFSSAPLAVLEEGRPGVTSASPSLVVMAEDVSSAVVGDVLERPGVRYRIAEKPEPEQPSGKITLVLELDI